MMRGRSKIVSGSLQTERVPNGNRKLLRDLTVDIHGRQYTVPKGFETDFSSIPWFGRMIVRWSRVDVAGVVHDYLYSHGDISRSRADWVWYQLAIASEHRANLLQAWVCWISLVLFGWTAWDAVRGTPLLKRLLSGVGVALLVVAAGWFSFSAYQRYQDNSATHRWIAEFRSRGANVQMNAYGGTGPLSRIPILRQLAVTQQFEVVIPTTTVAHNCIELLQECPETQRLWIHLHNVSDEAVQQLMDICPDIQYVRYTGQL